ncbi:hypothetical protein OESDEN_22673, partial [Oesophagostomum dentatum]
DYSELEDDDDAESIEERRRKAPATAKGLLQEQKELLRVQKVMLEKQAVLYGKMTEFFEKAATAMDRMLDRLERGIAWDVHRRQEPAPSCTPCDINIAESYVSL